MVTPVVQRHKAPEWLLGPKHASPTPTTDRSQWSTPQTTTGVFKKEAAPDWLQPYAFAADMSSQQSQSPGFFDGGGGFNSSGAKQDGMVSRAMRPTMGPTMSPTMSPGGGGVGAELVRSPTTGQ